MKLLFGLGAIAIICIVLFVAFDPSYQRQRDDHASYAAEQQRLDLETRRQQLARAQQQAPLDAVLWYASLCGVLVATGGLAWHLYAGIGERRRLVYPTAAGNLPVARRDVESGALADVAAQLLLLTRHVEGLAASRQAVPHTLHYAPHTTSSTSTAAALPAVEPVVAPLALPGLTDLASLSYAPTRDRILLGLAPGGGLITVSAPQLCHVALCGATGGGKSNLMRLLLPQLQAIGARVLLADPHFTPLDAESGDDWRPIAARLYQPPAVKPAQIDALLDSLVTELAQRLERRARGEKPGVPLFLALDELPVITDSVKDAIERLSKLLREGRKTNLFVVGASQDFLVKTLGGSSGVREAYRTAIYVGGDVVSASKLLDLPQRSIDDGCLETGLAYVRSAATNPAQVVRIPLASNAAVYRLLRVDEPASSADSAPARADDANAAAQPWGFHQGSNSSILANDSSIGVPAAGSDVPPVPPHDVFARIVLLLERGTSQSEAAKLLPGYHPRKYAQFKRWVDYVAGIVATQEQQQAAP